MTNEELDRLEALATHSRNNRYAFTAIEPFNLLSLIALARVGLAVTPRPMPADYNDLPPTDSFQSVLAYRPDQGWFEAGVAPGHAGIDGFWTAYGDDLTPPDLYPTHFIPISALPKPGVE